MTGSGTAEDPYVITTIDDLQDIDDDLTAYYQIANDIDASETVTWNGGAGFSPIGLAAGGFTGYVNHWRLDTPFTISNLYINRPTTDYVGLFSIIGSAAGGNFTGEVYDIALTNVNITGQEYVGALAGYVLNWDLGDIIESTVNNCSSTGTIMGTNCVGGLVGDNEIGIVA